MAQNETTQTYEQEFLEYVTQGSKRLSILIRQLREMVEGRIPSVSSDISPVTQILNEILCILNTKSATPRMAILDGLRIADSESWSTSRIRTIHITTDRGILADTQDVHKPITIEEVDSFFRDGKNTYLGVFRLLLVYGITRDKVTELISRQ